MLEKRGIQAAPVRGRRVLVRVDFNVPQDAQGQVADDRRIQEALPTLNHLRAAGARTILMSHLGRPDGQRDMRYTLRPIVHRLSAVLGQSVAMAEDAVGMRTLEMATRLKNGEFLMLENLRFHAGEEANDPAFASQLAQVGELFVEEAFGSLHRAHASTVGVPRHLPSFAGLLVQREVRELSRLVDAPSHPYVVLVGGAKVADKLPLLTSFLGRADGLLIGGALSFPFLKATGASLGATAVDRELESDVQAFLQKAKASGTTVQLPEDVVVERPGKSDPETAALGSIPKDGVIRDIGPATRGRFAATLQRAQLVFWNGPMGLAEDPRYAAGTREVLAALAQGSGYHVAAGGDSARIANDLGVTNAFQYVSTGGGAALDFVRGADLPGLSILPDA
ncbi:MAG: phosphoglycerate kinase [Thermoplasmata archaeon]